jgi:pilus assembly protein CpaB
MVAAARDLPAGVALTAEDLTTIDWPENLVLEGAITKTEQVVGRPLLYSVGARRPVTERDLADTGSGFGLSVKIPEGMRATAVRSNEIVGVAGFLFPGSHVDVLATYTAPGTNSSMTQTVLQNVEVLTAGTATEPDPQGKPQTVSVVTLLLNPEDSQRLLLISTQGTIQFVLRSGADREKLSLTPTRLEQLLLPEPTPTPVAAAIAPPAPKRVVVEQPKPAEPPQPVEPPKPVETPKPAEPPKPPEVRAPEVHRPIIEMIQGTQRSIQEF